MQTIEKTSITPFNSSQAHLLAALALVDLRVRWAVVRARANGLNPQDEFRGLYIADDQVDQLLQFELGQHMWSQLNGHGLNGHAPVFVDHAFFVPGYFYLGRSVDGFC
jgi:hypothetical protein